MRMSPVEVARKFVMKHFPRCDLAVVGGSAGSGNYDDYSDIDIIIFEKDHHDFYRKIFRYDQWFIECIVLTPFNYRELFDEGIRAANPGLQRLIAEGIIIRCLKKGKAVIAEAQNDISYGPMPWSGAEIDYARYMITDYLADLNGARNQSEQWFVVNKLVCSICEFILRVNNQWTGEGKHLHRYVASFSPELAVQMDKALEDYAAGGEVTGLIRFCTKVLEPYGGTLMEGYEQ